jgi:outer membrane protein assembly factor BamB
VAAPCGSFSSSFSKSFNNEVMALDLQSNKLLWKYTPTDRQFPFYSSPAIAGGRVFVGSTTAASTGSISPAARKSGNTKPPRP